MNKSILFLLCVLFSFSFQAKAQNKLTIHSESIDSLFVWFNNGFSKDEIARLLKIPANQIMEQLLHKNKKDAIGFSDALHRFSATRSLSDNDYLLNDAYGKHEQISILKDRLIEFSITSSPIEYVKEYFPADFMPSSRYNIFFTATGWQWGDAMTFNYIQEGDKLITSQKGTPAIIFNLTIITSTYGETIDKQVASFKKVINHELFHALFDEYITDKNYYTPDQIESETLFMLMNEGIAHYIADRDYLKANYENLKAKEQSCFSLFNEKAKIIFDENEDMTLRNEAFEEGLYGSYWDKYICMTGLFMTYHIYQYGGLDLLRECIENGYNYFIGKYNEICETNKDLPRLRF